MSQASHPDRPSRPPHPQRRDRLRELLDAALDEEHDTLDRMARGAHASVFHFHRELRRQTGEAPASLRRRVLLERAAWELARGARVTDAAWTAGYGSVDGFSRAFSRAYGHPPGEQGVRRSRPWLPAPNGVHFHPPTSLWVDDAAGERAADPVLAQLVEHDLDDTTDLLDAATRVDAHDLVRPLLPGHVVLTWDGPEEHLLAVLDHHVTSKAVWLAAVAGEELPDLAGGRTLAEVVARHEDVGPRWLATVRDLDRRGAWQDRLVDALCDPPETFVIGSVVTHVLTFAGHRRLLARGLLRRLGHDTDHADQGDPITWLRRRTEEPR